VLKQAIPLDASDTVVLRVKAKVGDTARLPRVDGRPMVEVAHAAQPPRMSWLRLMMVVCPSFFASLLVHMTLLVLLALWVVPAEVRQQLIDELIATPESPLPESDLEVAVEEPVEELNVEVNELAEVEPQPETQIVEAESDFGVANDAEAAAIHIDLTLESDFAAPQNLLRSTNGVVLGNGLSGRGREARAALVRTGGGNQGSQDAVASALKWISEHQNPDGSWGFDHRLGPCQGRCPNPGSLAAARNGATAMALLPFLGSGQTHKEGDHQREVASGLYYLAKSMEVSRQGGSLMDPGNAGMYSHGLAAIALTEAYGMTQDRGLLAPAQASLNFIASAQDPVGGGWRYEPRQRGDTSAVGWQIMALKSGHMAYLGVSPLTVGKASHFLDSVQADSGAAYGYNAPGTGAATSAIGLLCRMYLGWEKDNPALERGVQAIAKRGPSKSDMYYNYYAMQVMFQHTGAEGAMWARWNQQLRDYLISAQTQHGHAAGSWYFGDAHAGPGGRLYCTSLATMCLEVYYRHMPIYKEEATTVDFPE
jgi:hypothetical protein